MAVISDAGCGFPGAAGSRPPHRDGRGFGGGGDRHQADLLITGAGEKIMQLLGGALSLFLGPRGCLGLIAFIAIPMLVNHRFGGNSGYWAFGGMLILAVLPIGMSNGRAGLMRAAQAILALMIASFGLLTFVGFYSSGFADGRAWVSAVVHRRVLSRLPRLEAPDRQNRRRGAGGPPRI